MKNKNEKAKPRCPNIEGELRAICVPCNNSNLSHIKVICEKALISFRHYRDVVQKTNDDNKNYFKHFPITDVCSACREAIITSINYSEGTQLFILGINCLQQILIPGLLDTFHKITLLAVLNEVSIKVTSSMRARIKNSNNSFNYYNNYNIGYNFNIGGSNSQNNAKNKNNAVSATSTGASIVNNGGGTGRGNSVLNCSNSEKEQILLKVIQTSLLFLNPEIIEFNEVMITLLVSIISSFFGISGYYQLAQMSHLAIRQLVNLSLDYIHLNSGRSNKNEKKNETEDAEKRKSGEESEVENNRNEESFVIALLLIKDISIMIDKQVIENVMVISATKQVQEGINKSFSIQDDDDLTPLSLLKGGITIPSSICLDIWNEILDQNNVNNSSKYNRNLLLENNDDLKSLINNVLFPSLTRCIQNSCKELNSNMSQNMHDFVMFARYIRLFIKILEYNVSKKFNGPYIKDCICNIVLSFVKTISVHNISKIPSWSVQCILEMFGEIIQNPDILLIIGSINIKNYYHRANSSPDCEFGSENLLNSLINSLNQILIHLSNQLELLQSNENTLNLSVPSFLNEKINLPSILLPQPNDTNIECGYFIISNSKKKSERNVRLIDIIMEDDRIYHILKCVKAPSCSAPQSGVLNEDSSTALTGNHNSQALTKRLNGSNCSGSADSYDNINLNAKYCSSVYSVVLVSLKPIEISLLIFDIIVNLTSCLNLMCDGEGRKDCLENIIINIWDPLYQLLKQCMNYHLLRYYTYRIITFLYKISSITCPKLDLRNVLNIIYESMQIYYNNSQLVEVRILTEPILIEKIFSLYKCYLSICYQYCEYLDETCWQYLFRYMEYIDRIIDIGLGSKIKTNANSGDSGDTPLSSSDQTTVNGLLCLDPTAGESEIFEFEFRGKDDKPDSEHLTKTLVAESTILRVSHQVFLKEQIKKLSQESIYCIIKGIYQELNYNINGKGFEIKKIEYLLTRFSSIIQCIYDQMSYELFIPIWNDRIIPLLFNIIKLNNFNMYDELADSDGGGESRFEIDKANQTCEKRRSSLNGVCEDNGERSMQVFNSIMDFLSVTITTIFVYIDKDEKKLHTRDNIQTSLLNPYLVFANYFPMYNTVLVRSLYSILCSVLPELDESTWILIVAFINIIVCNKYQSHIRYLDCEKLASPRGSNFEDTCLKLTDREQGGISDEAQRSLAFYEEDVELLQSSFLLIEFLCNETEMGNRRFISSSWNILIESIAVFGRINSSSDNISFQAVSLLWRLTDLIGTKLVANQSTFRDFFESENEANHVSCGNHEVVFDKRNILIYRDRDKNVFFSNHVHIDIVWLNIILQLEDLCIDSRQETRNCALKSLYTALIKHYKNVVSNDLLQLVIKRVLKSVLVGSYNRYLSSFCAYSGNGTDCGLENTFLGDVLDFEFAIEQGPVKCNGQGESNEGLGDSESGGGNATLNGPSNDTDRSNQLSRSFSNPSYKNQSWEETLGITIDGTLRIVKELSHSNSDNNNIYYECSLFLMEVVSQILLARKDCEPATRRLVSTGREVQITSVKVLYELMCVSLRKNDCELWNKSVGIYSELINCLLFQSHDTLRRLERAEEYIKKRERQEQESGESGDEDARRTMYRNYNSYANKLSKYYLSDKLAETILQTVVDIINLIADENGDNIAKCIKFGNFYCDLLCLLNMVIVVVTSTNTFVHNTTPIEASGRDDSGVGGDHDFSQSVCNCVWGKGFFGNDLSAGEKDLFVPKLVNYDKDRGFSRSNGSNLVLVENYNNSDFIHKNYYRNLRGISLLSVFPDLASENGDGETRAPASGRIAETTGPNVVYLLRNIKHPGACPRKGASFSYYNKCVESTEGVDNGGLKGDAKSGGANGAPSYTCSIKSSNDFLSSAINRDIRFVTTIQTMGLEALQYYLNMLPGRILEHGARSLKSLVSDVTKAITGSLVAHSELFKDTCKIGMSCKAISLIVGFNRNAIIDTATKIRRLSGACDWHQAVKLARKLLVEEGSLVSQLLETLPYIFGKLLGVVSRDLRGGASRITGIWMVAKEAALVMIQDWLAFFVVLENEKKIKDAVVPEFDLKIRERFWPLAVDVVTRLIDSRPFAARSNRCPRPPHNAANADGSCDECLYFDVFAVNVSFDLMLSLDGHCDGRRNADGKGDSCRRLVMPEEYYSGLVRFLDGISTRTLDMYIIERLFEFYDELPLLGSAQTSSDVLPVLYARVGRMFRSFSKEDLQSGLRPLPQLKIDEIYKLISLTTDHFRNLVGATERGERNGATERSSLEQLLEKVLPGLIECVTCKDQSIRQNVKNSLKVITKHLSLAR
ncbi:hypothetical protein FG386_001815 [Cryptosporidium ryanae]|uniref:uncharacterized protein n=1 Tax=Cryptosporidium ryanae TaxID=515981 RepID=UPI003519F3AC|nr:hypothetical protein FG386_001815 [Cryptosporidium ryanae]